MILNKNESYIVSLTFEVVGCENEKEIEKQFLDVIERSAYTKSAWNIKEKGKDYVCPICEFETNRTTKQLAELGLPTCPNDGEECAKACSCGKPMDEDGRCEGCVNKDAYPENV